MENFQPPQPIPYPKNDVYKFFLRLPIFLYRLGLGPLIGKYILILSTYGRKTDKIHRTPVEYFRYQDRIYIMSGFGEKPDWYKNLQHNPLAGLNIKNERLSVKARKPESETEWKGVTAFLQSSPVSQLSLPEMVNQLENPSVQKTIRNWPTFTFDPTKEAGPPPLEADLVWAWPLILLTGAWLILLGWLHHRNK